MVNSQDGIVNSRQEMVTPQMDFNEALKIVQGALRFLRALSMLEETLGKAVEAKQLLVKLDHEKEVKTAELAEITKSLVAAKESKASQDALLEAAKMEAAARAASEYGQIVEAKRTEVNEAARELAQLQKNVNSIKAEIGKLEGKRDAALAKANTAQQALVEVQTKHKAFIAKITG